MNFQVNNIFDMGIIEKNFIPKWLFNHRSSEYRHSRFDEHGQM